MVKKCYTPVKKVCDGTGPEICKTVYESSCTTKYIDKSQNGTAFVGDTQCEKLPVAPRAACEKVIEHMAGSLENKTGPVVKKTSMCKKMRKEKL